MPCKALWLKENEPDTYSNARRICEYTDWMTHRLTGEWTASINNGSNRWYYDRDEGGWPESLYGAVGLEDLLEKFPKDVLDLGKGPANCARETARRRSASVGHPRGTRRSRRLHGHDRTERTRTRQDGPHHRVLTRHARPGRRTHSREGFGAPSRTP